MKKYILNRILWIIFTIIAASIIAFTLMYFMRSITAEGRAYAEDKI